MPEVAKKLVHLPLVPDSVISAHASGASGGTMINVLASGAGGS